LYPRHVLLACDETDLLLFPPLRATWAPRGEPAPVFISGWNAKRVLFGAIHLRTGRRLFLARKRHKAEDFKEFLWLIHHHYRAWHVTLLLDEDKSHIAGGTRELARKLGIELLWLPKRSPQLNPMDHLWREPKKVVCANHQYATIDEEVERVTKYLLGLSPKEALRRAGILSPDFWLR